MGMDNSRITAFYVSTYIKVSNIARVKVFPAALTAAAACRGRRQVSLANMVLEGYV
jgi:hypothetical protein